jgi:hypothetical protein
MPRDVFEKLRLPLEPTGMCLELGDNSIRYPLGIAEDVPMKVGHHFIPVDFVVLEMGEREKTPLILGRPFLKTVGATIDVGKGEIMFDINGERSSFTFQPRLEACNMIGVKEEPKKKEGLKKKKEPKKMNVKNQGRCCIRQDKGRKAACEDQKNDKAGRQARAQDGAEVGTKDCNARKER